MSELQVGLIVIGVVVVAAVFFFNWFQERRFRRRVEHAFKDRADDVLMSALPQSSGANERLEPRLAPEASDSPAVTEERTDREAGPQDAPVVVASEPKVGAAVLAAPTSLIDYVCTLEADQPIAPSVFTEFLRNAAAVGKPVQIYGWQADQQAWVALGGVTGSPVMRVSLAMQLVNRAGAAKRVQIASFRDLVRQLAEGLGARYECPEIDPAAHRSVELDKFCADVDVSVGVNLIAREGAAMAGTKVRGLAEASGLRLEPEGSFTLRSERNEVLVTLSSQDGTPFERERLHDLMLNGVTLIMDVPRVPDGLTAFDRTLDLGRRFADALDATLVDDNRALLTEAGIARIRAHLRSVYAAMHERGIEPGGAIALRLFS